MNHETYERKGYTVEIHTDEDPPNPRKEWDNAGVMCCEHRRYDLGDGGMDLLFDALEADSRWDETELNLPDDEEMPEPEDYQALLDLAQEWAEKKDFVRYTILPLYLYDHSGITMNTTGFSCPWDSGQVGIIFMTPQARCNERFTEEEAEKYLRGEVEAYDQYLTGDVYGFIVKDKDDEELDSCWGFFGLEYVKEEADRVVDYYVKENGEQLELDL